jgi:hypothetical protein
VTLIVGAPKPGVQTKPGNQGLLLAQIRFLTIAEGDADITLTPESAMYTNLDNSKSQSVKNSLVLNIQKEAALPGSGQQNAFSGTILPRYAELQPSSTVKEQVIQTSPKAGEVFFYFRPVELSWSGGTASEIKSLILYLNGEPYGVVAENLPNNGSYTWTPSLSIPLPMVVPENTYSFQIVSQNKNQENKSDPALPFGIISDPNGKITPSNFQPKNADSLTPESGSMMLSRWGERLSIDSDLDLNNDWVINYLDWYLLRKALFVKDLVY